MAETIAELLEEGEDVTKCLTTGERERLKACEKIIEDNLQAVVKVGEALAEIRDYRLYRKDYDTFERYCKSVWDFSKAYAYRMIKSNETVDLLSKKVAHGRQNSENVTHEHATPTPPDEYPNHQNELQFEAGEIGPEVITLPQNERQIRPLTKLKDPEERVKAWDLVMQKQKEGKKLTAFLVQECVKEIKGDAEETKKKSAKKAVKQKEKEVEDSHRLSEIFKTQYNVLLQIVFDEKNAEWTRSSKNEVLRYLRELVEIAERDDY